MSDQSLEEWRGLPEPYDKYEISSWGNCRNARSGRLLKKQPRGGYLKYGLCVDGRVVDRFAHRLVAMSFLPETFSDILTINHIDRNPHNNRVENLECVTQKENNAHKSKHEHRRISQKNKPVDQYSLDGILVKEYVSIREAERETGFWQAGIAACAQGKFRTAHGFIWKYKESYDAEGETWVNFCINGKEIKISSAGRISVENGLKNYGWKTDTGYLRVQVNGKKYYVHRLVADIFCAKPADYNKNYVVDHQNEIKTDNRAANLRWVTKSENSNFAKRKRVKPLQATSTATGEVLLFCVLQNCYSQTS